MNEGCSSTRQALYINLLSTTGFNCKKVTSWKNLRQSKYVDYQYTKAYREYKFLHGV